MFSYNENTSTANNEKPKPEKKGVYNSGEDSVQSSPIFMALGDGIGGCTTSSKFISEILTNRCTYDILIQEFTTSELGLQTDAQVFSVNSCLAKALYRFTEYLNSVYSSFDEFSNAEENLDALSVSTTFVSAELQEVQDFKSGRKVNLVEISQVGDSLARIYRLVRHGDGQKYINQIYGTDEQQDSFNFPHQINSDFSKISSVRMENFSLEDSLVFKIQIEVNPGDIVLIGSDGVFDNLYDVDLEIILNYMLRNKRTESHKQTVESIVETIRLYRVALAYSTRDVVKMFLSLSDLTSLKKERILEKFESQLPEADESVKSVVFDEETNTLTFRDGYAERIFKDVGKNIKRDPNFEDLGTIYLETNEEKIDDFFRNFDKLKIAQVVADVAKEISHDTFCISPFSVKAFQFGEFDPGYIGSKEDDISVAASVIVQKPIDLNQIKSIMLNLNEVHEQSVKVSGRNLVQASKDIFGLQLVQPFPKKFRYDISPKVGLDLSLDMTNKMESKWCSISQNKLSTAGQYTFESNIVYGLFIDGSQMSSWIAELNKKKGSFKFRTGERSPRRGEIPGSVSGMDKSAIPVHKKKMFPLIKGAEPRSDFNQEMDDMFRKTQKGAYQPMKLRNEVQPFPVQEIMPGRAVKEPVNAKVIGDPMTGRFNPEPVKQLPQLGSGKVKLTPPKLNYEKLGGSPLRNEYLGIHKQQMPGAGLMLPKLAEKEKKMPELNGIQVNKPKSQPIVVTRGKVPEMIADNKAGKQQANQIQKVIPGEPKRGQMHGVLPSLVQAVQKKRSLSIDDKENSSLEEEKTNRVQLMLDQTRVNSLNGNRETESHLIKMDRI